MVDAAHVAQLRLVEDKSRDTSVFSAVNKWDVLRALAVAKRIYAVSDRDLTVLQALLSFHPETMLGQSRGPLVVHPSNASICERLNGMPCSSMRRHLANLIAAGLLIRRDSPNGKRYSRHYAGEKIAYGFDLSPLWHRAAEFEQQASEVHASAAALTQARDNLRLMRRDLLALLEHGHHIQPELPLWAEGEAMAMDLQSALKSRQPLTEMKALAEAVAVTLQAVKMQILSAENQNMSTSASQNEHHYQRSNKENDLKNTSDLMQASSSLIASTPEEEIEIDLTEHSAELANVTLGMVLRHCNELQSYAANPITNWDSLISNAEHIRPMMGLSQSAWQNALAAMGRVPAAITVAAMLERFAQIKSPSAYLNHLAAKARNGCYSVSVLLRSMSRMVAA